MQIWIHDSKMQKITALNNDIPDMLSYSNSTWHSYLDQATSTFDFTIPKFSNGELHEDIKLINDECFVSFYVNGSYQVFYIATLQEDDFNIQLTCNNTNLEYALEYANPFSADGAQTIEWYLNHMTLLSFAAVEIGINEISDRKRTLTFDSQETKMARLQSLMSNFDAEFEFKVELNRDGTYKRVVINIYQKADATHHGIGTDRKDVVLYYSNGLKGVQVISDKTQMFNEGEFTGKDGLNLANVEISEKNSDGIVEFYSPKGNPRVYAPLSMQRYPATMRAEGQDNWIRKDFTTEYENVNDLKAYALRTLKQYAYPLMTYTASVQSVFVNQYTDLKLGDTVRIVDKNFSGGLALEARVSEMIISFDNPNNNSLVFTNYRKIDNKPTSALQSRIDKAVEDRLPYRIELATTGGVTFKNNEGETIVKPSLYKGNIPYTTDVTWRWALDGNVTVGMQYLVKAKDIDETAVLTVAAYVGNTEVATTEITLTNVDDGAKGEDGRGEVSRETFYKLTNSADVPTAPSGNRNLALGTSADWSSGWTSFNGQNNQADTIYRIYNRGFKIGDKVNVRLVLKYSDIAAVEGQTAAVMAQCEGNVTHWGMGQLSVGNRFYFNESDGEIELKGTVVVDEYILKNDFWFWRLRVDYVTSGHITWKEAKAEISETATPYSQAPEDLGWSTDTLVPTQSNRYLWKFEYIYYSDGSVKIAEPVNLSIAGATGPQGIQGLQGPKGDQGIQGPKGTDGKTQYTHIAYADNATGGGFSQTDQTKTYIGMYVDFTATDSNDPTKYRWSKWHGDKGATGAQGIQGPKGDDGKTPYLHIAYANSADGRTDFSTSNSGNKRYLGTYTDYTQADSTDPTKYKWVDMVGSVEVGGRNLIVKSTAQAGLRLAPNAGTITDQAHSLSDWIEVEPNTTYTLTTYEDVNEANMYYSLAWYITNNADYSGWISLPTGAASAADLKGGKQYKSPANATYAKVSYPTNYPKVKLERGNVVTDYSPAPEDVQSDIDNKADQTFTQQQLNALAEQNGIVKAEMEAKASIDTVNQWITAYQNYVNANDEAKAKSEKNLQEAAARILQLKTDVGALRQQWDFIDTYMTIQNEGLIIGKSDGSAYAKFANDRISLFSGSSEVMYISQGVLRIKNGIFTKTIQIGRFRFETHPADQDMLVLRYLGG